MRFVTNDSHYVNIYMYEVGKYLCCQKQEPFENLPFYKTMGDLGKNDSQTYIILLICKCKIKMRKKI